ncbi:hypothetical protein Tco_1095383 [Tanacetum coccineum]
MDKLEKHLIEEKLHENDYKTASTALRTMLEKIFDSELLKFLNFNFMKYTGLETQHFKDKMIGDIDYIKKYMIEIILHEKEIEKKLKEKLLQTQEVQRNTIKAIDASSVTQNECSRKVNENSVSGNENSSSGNKSSQLGISSSISENDTKANGADIRPTYDTDSLE